MKRIVALAVAAAGAAVVGRRWQARQAEQALWTEITDPAPHPRSTGTARSTDTARVGGGAQAGTNGTQDAESTIGTTVVGAS